MIRSIQQKFLVRLTATATLHTSSTTAVATAAKVTKATKAAVCNRTSIMAGVVVDKKFPGDSLVPKHETGVIQFLKKYPNYNGDGVTIAILDSGVDPKANGLEKTPDGSVKVIERFDCSGCGDVDTTKKVSPTPDDEIVGLSGRTLKLSESIKKEFSGNEYRIGLKSLHDLYPAKVNEKMNADAKFKTWDEKHKTAIAETSKRSSDFEAANAGNTNLSLADKLVKEDIDGTLECLQAFDKQYMDVKTYYDVLLYETKTGWRCSIDVSLNGDLEKAISVGEYSKTHEIKSIDDFLSVSMNVHDDGNVLEIVGMCSSHGTHVASIAAGNHKTSDSNEELDGVAPGAKIVSLTIGDGRLGSMETGTAIVRALMKIMELCNAGRRVHLINMSYGEFTHWSTSGRIGEIMNEIVNDYGVVWVASAGNHGPALCTIGTPPDISQPACIGVGAYVSPEMMEAEYSLREKLPANVYTWTSRDPCIDGGEGVTVCAPGAAIASVPQFTLNNQQLMNGTSMSAPHVCGSIALLISGLLKNKIDYSPYSIKRALWNTATQLQHVDKFAQGNGLLDVNAAYDNLVKYHDRSERDVRFSVSVGSQNAKGIHLRRGLLNKPEEFNVTIQPVFMMEKKYASKSKIEFNKRLTLIPSKPWIQCGSFLDLCYSARSIVVKIDPTTLPPGVHTGKIRAYECDDVEKGTLFEIPVTVVQPIVLPPESNWQHDFEEVLCKPNTIMRHFILVPNNASWAVVRLRSNDKVKSTQAKFLVHTMQIIPQKYCKTFDTQKILPVSSENDTLHTFKVEQNNILEVCIAKYWSNFGTTTISASISFHGVRASLPNTMVHNASGVHRVDLTSLCREELVPSIQLKTASMVLKPTETKISPLTSRDILPFGRQIYQNLLTFVLNLSKQQEVAFSLPLLNNVLYESEFESQLYMCFDSNRRQIVCGDAYSGSNFYKMPKGEYTIKVQVRHEKKELLEKLNDATLTASFKLSAPLNLDIHSTYKAAVLGEKKVTSLIVPASRPVPFYIAPLSNEKLTKAGLVNQCAWLQGVLSTSKDETARKLDQITFDYILPDGPAVAKKNGSTKLNNKEGKSKYDEYLEGLRDYQNGQIAKLELADAEKIYANLIKEFPTYLTAHISLIQKLEVAESKNSLPLTFKSSLCNTQDLDTPLATLKRIVTLADTVIKGTNVDRLLSYFGLKNDSRADAAKIKSEMEKQKNNLLDAYVRKAVALGKINMIEAKQSEIDSEVKITPVADDIDAIFTEVGKFTDYFDQKILILSLWHAYTKQHHGRMWKVLTKMNEEKQQRDFLEEMQLVAQAKNWGHVADILQKITVSAHPANYRLF